MENEEKYITISKTGEVLNDEWFVNIEPITGRNFTIAIGITKENWYNQKVLLINGKKHKDFTFNNISRNAVPARKDGKERFVFSVEQIHPDKIDNDYEYKTFNIIEVFPDAKDDESKYILAEPNGHYIKWPEEQIIDCGNDELKPVLLVSKLDHRGWNVVNLIDLTTLKPMIEEWCGRIGKFYGGIAEIRKYDENGKSLYNIIDIDGKMSSLGWQECK